MSNNPNSDELKLPTSNSFHLSTIIGSTLHSIIDAQNQSALSTLNFILKLTKDPNKAKELISKEEDLSLNKMKLKFEQMRFDSKTRTFKSDTNVLDIPLLSLVPIPYLNISEAEFDFDVDIHNIEDHEDLEQQDTTKSSGLIMKQPKMKASISSQKSNRDERTSDLRIKIKVKQDHVPEGLSHLLSIVGDSIVQKNPKKEDIQQ